MKKINIITHNNQYGLSQDIMILVNNLKKFYKNNVDFNHLNFFDFKFTPADINIFLETPSKQMFDWAPINILIPNQEWYYNTWTDYVDNFDYILTKTKYAYDIFSDLVKNKDKVKYLGWKSKDMYDNKIKKSYKKCFHLCGGSFYKNTQNLIDNWDKSMPKLTVLYNPFKVKVNQVNSENIDYITDVLSEEELIKVMNEHGIHICCSETEGFGHYIQEAKSCKSVVITTNGGSMNEFINDTNGFLVDICKKEKLSECLGEKFIVDSDRLNNIVKFSILQNEEIIEKKCKSARNSFLHNLREFDNNMKKIFDKIFKKNMKMSDIIYNKDTISSVDLPYVSLITLTHNRRDLFKVALHNYKHINYPKDKFEWLIIDDGSDTVMDMIPCDDNINYIYIKDKLDLGKKRNFSVEQAKYDIVAFMDDDDYYYPSHLKMRVNYLINSERQCVTCSTIGCFDINKYISIMNVPPHQLAFEDRVSEATLIFYKDFWEKQKFSDESKGGEGNEFLKGRQSHCLEVSWEYIIVSLLHSRNTSNRVVRGDKPNGCHFNLNDDLFLFITNLDKQCPEEDKQMIKEEIALLERDKKDKQQECEQQIKAEAITMKDENDEKMRKKQEMEDIVDKEINNIKNI